MLSQAGDNPCTIHSLRGLLDHEISANLAANVRILNDLCPLALGVGALFHRQKFTEVGRWLHLYRDINFKRPPTLVARTECPDALVKSLALTSALRIRLSAKT